MCKGGEYETTGCCVCVCVFVCRTLGCVWLREWVWGSKRGFKYRPGKVRIHSGWLKSMSCKSVYPVCVCMCVFLCWGLKAIKTQANLKRRCRCVSVISLRGMPIHKRWTHTCTDPTRRASVHTHWSSLIGPWLYALVISHTQIMSIDWTENRSVV